jgi:DNA-binding transcriptional LysR family regulator
MHPEVRIDLEEQVSQSVVSALREARADIGIFVEGADSIGLDARYFRSDQLVLLVPVEHRLADAKEPVAFGDALDDEWITLTAGAAILHKLQQAALSANRNLKVRMQVRSFDAVCHMVSSGMGVAVLPKDACLPIIKDMSVAWRSLADPWARRRLLVATGDRQKDGTIESLVEFLTSPVSEPSKKAKVDGLKGKRRG